MNCNLYDLFKEIKEEDLNNINNVHDKLLELIGKKKIMIKK